MEQIMPIRVNLGQSQFSDKYGRPIPFSIVRQYLKLFWVLNPNGEQCPECVAYAKSSPYVAPGIQGNHLDAAPGDGHTSCGENCTCDLRYGPLPDYIMEGLTSPPRGVWEYLRYKVRQVFMTIANHR